MITNLYEFYKTTSEKFSERPLFNNKITYAECMELVEQRAAFLQSEGFKKGDVIAMLALSNAEWAVTYMAITSIGAVILPLDINLPQDNYPAMLKKVKAKALFVSDEFKGFVKEIKTYPVSLNKSLDKNKKFEAPTLSINDHASYLYTSGTTGTPKIIILTHGNIFQTTNSCADRIKLSAKEVFLCLLPLYHVYALVACFTGPFARGCSINYLTSLKGPDIMKALSDNPISVFPAAPQLWETIMDGILNKVKDQSNFKYQLFIFFLKNGVIMRNIGLSFLVNKIFKPIHDILGDSHSFFISGGAPLKDKYRLYYKSMGFTVIEGYGLTETTGPITLSDPFNNTIGSVGAPVEGNEAKLKNINSEGIGELWLKGVSVMPEYYNNEQSTTEAFDDYGFFNTGDLARIDKYGNVFITGRTKNVIALSSGKNVYPEELESYYKQSDAIEEIAVFERHVGGKEKVYAVIVPTKKSNTSYGIIKDEINRLNRGLPSYKTVNDFAISFDKLPVNSVRKIVYRDVITLLEKGVFMENDNDKAILQTILTGLSPAEIEIIDILKKKLKADKLYARQTLADFGIDSLGLVDLLVHLEEKLNITIDTEKLKKLQTIEELVLYLSSLEKGVEQNIEERLFKGEITQKPLLFFNPFLYVWIWLIKLLFKYLWRTDVINHEKLDIKNNIILANHTSYFDIPILVKAIPAMQIKNTYAIGKKSVSGVKYVFHGIPVIWIEDEREANEIFKKTSDLLRQGKSIVIFPEGSRSEDNEMHEFKLGAAYVAKNLNKEIIPITINGTFDIWSRSKKFPNIFGFKKCNLIIHDKIKPSDFKTAESLNEKLEKVIKSDIDKTINKPSS